MPTKVSLASMFDARIDRLMKAPAGAFATRALYEARYVRELTKADGGKWNTVIDNALSVFEAGLAADGALTDGTGEKAEAALAPAAGAAKRYNLICVGHAHIDMNWMWRYDETVAITLDTFRTTLEFMREFPDFRFSQSQASVYEIVERYDPDMLDEIRKRVKSGQWEVAASTWVEADKNMPSGESVARHLLYTRRYLTKLLGVSAEGFNLDFEPDTFGHPATVPETLAQGGVKYYYHCRGDEGEMLYRWRAPSGAEILCYREPFWYLGGITPDYALYAPAFCELYGTDTHMRVYGVGDHGGGPTRRDIELVRDMARWPVFPNVSFGTYKEFYEAASKSKKLQVVEGELNCIFTGCYTSQSRIKQANRFGEAKLDEAEKFAAQSKLRAGGRYPHERFERAWRNVLFNQFHDILPGSGVIDTREHALGLFTEAVAAADTEKRYALRMLGEMADTSQHKDEEALGGTTSEGAGVGFGVGFGMAGLTNTSGENNAQPFRISQVDRGRGMNRIYHIFNPSAEARNEVVELTLFDWPGDLRRLVINGGDGKALRHQLVDGTPRNFWGHSYVRVLTEIELPAGGRHTCVLKQSDRLSSASGFPRDPRTERPHEYILENEYLRAEFCPDSGALLALTSKKDKTELLSGPAALFRIIDEQPARNTAGTAWTVGRYRALSDMSADVKINEVLTGPLKNAIEIQARARSSTVTYTVSLAAGARMLEFDCDVDWREVGEKNERTQQLNFALPVLSCLGGFMQDIPGGLLERPSKNQDMPCQSFSAARYSKDCALMLMSDSKYGFRCEIDERYGYITMNLDCMRSSTDPDAYPEFGRHRFRIGVGVSEADGVSLLNSSYDFCHPASVVSDFPRKGGGAPMKAAGIEVAGAFLQAAKIAEEGGALILRLVEPNGADAEVTATFWSNVKGAEIVDTHENPAPAVKPEEGGAKSGAVAGATADGTGTGGASVKMADAGDSAGAADTAGGADLKTPDGNKDDASGSVGNTGGAIGGNGSAIGGNDSAGGDGGDSFAGAGVQAPDIYARGAPKIDGRTVRCPIKGAATLSLRITL